MSRCFSLGLLLILACGGDGEEVCTQLRVITYPDSDGDGYGGAGAEETCGTPAGRTQSPGDCDDDVFLVNVRGVEICDDIDNDCDGEVDDGLVFTEWYVDNDGDGYGVAASVIRACTRPDGFSATADDCDDTVTSTHLGAAEVCDGADNDCDGDIDQDDETLDLNSMFIFYADADQDTFGDPAVFTRSCFARGNMVDNDDDCDDSRNGVNPLAAERCSRMDDDCDGLIDEADPSLDPALLTTYYTDSDGDGFGDPFALLERCFQPDYASLSSDDCDDSDALVGLPSDWYEDLDGDGYGAGVAVEFAQCVPTDLTLISDGGLDCDDTDQALYPSAFEVCGDAVDSNCDGFDCNNYIEDFETGVMDPFWAPSGNASWLIASASPYEGSYYAESGNITDNGVSAMQATFNFLDPGAVAFWHSGSTESNSDYLKVYVDGAEMMSRSGIWGWTYEQIPIDVGVHVVNFEYAKNGSVAAGDDAVYIDLIQTISAAVP